MEFEFDVGKAKKEIDFVKTKSLVMLRGANEDVFFTIFKVTTPLVPMLTGNLRASARDYFEEHGDELHYIITYFTLSMKPRKHRDGTKFKEPYAVYQERGYGYEQKPYVKYTTPGTGPNFLGQGLYKSVPYVRVQLGKVLDEDLGQVVII